MNELESYIDNLHRKYILYKNNFWIPNDHKIIELFNILSENIYNLNILYNEDQKKIYFKSSVNGFIVMILNLEPNEYMINYSNFSNQIQKYLIEYHNGSHHLCNSDHLSERVNTMKTPDIYKLNAYSTIYYYLKKIYGFNNKDKSTWYKFN